MLPVFGRPGLWAAGGLAGAGAVTVVVAVAVGRLASVPLEAQLLPLPERLLPFWLAAGSLPFPLPFWLAARSLPVWLASVPLGWQGFAGGVGWQGFAGCVGWQGFPGGGVSTFGGVVSVAGGVGVGVGVGSGVGVCCVTDQLILP